MPDVKPSSRAERARATRERMRDAARDLFVEAGYAETTMKEIADAAGVAVQTVYYTFQTKGALLREVLEVTAAGDDDPDPVMTRAWVREALAAPSQQRVLALVVEHGTAIYERVAALWPAAHAAAAVDADVHAYWRGVSAGRRSGQGAFAAHLAELGELRSGVDVERGTDLIAMLAGHDPYRSLVVDAGWPIVDYKAWLFTTLVDQLLGRRRLSTAAVRDLSFAHLVATG